MLLFSESVFDVLSFRMAVFTEYVRAAHTPMLLFYCSSLYIASEEKSDSSPCFLWCLLHPSVPLGFAFHDGMSAICLIRWLGDFSVWNLLRDWIWRFIFFITFRNLFVSTVEHSSTALYSQSLIYYWFLLWDRVYKLLSYLELSLYSKQSLDLWFSCLSLLSSSDYKCETQFQVHIWNFF